MRSISTRWLWLAGVLAVVGGCRNPERPCACESKPPCCAREKPDCLPPVMPEAYPASKPAKLPDAPKPCVPQPPAKYVEHVDYKPGQPAQYAHAPDHRWLVGRLERDTAKGVWQLRYADPGEKDPHGGRMELLGTGRMDGFHEGQTVRAEGELVDPAPLEIHPSYRVRSLQAIR